MRYLGLLLLAGACAKSASVPPLAEPRPPIPQPPPEPEPEPEPPAAEELPQLVDREAYNEVIRNSSAGLKTCYEVALKMDPELKGRVVFDFEVRDERASNLAVADNTTGSTSFANCLANELRAWEYVGVPDARVNQPFVFAPVE